MNARATKVALIAAALIAGALVVVVLSAVLS